MNNIIKVDHFRIYKHNSFLLMKYVVVERRGPREELIGKLGIEKWKVLEERVLSVINNETDGENDHVIIKDDMIIIPVMPGREISILIWALIEDEKGKYMESIFHGWRELAREERWWLYRKCAMPGQKKGMGWRKALLYALGGGSSHFYNQNYVEEKNHDKVKENNQMGLFE